ncbi:MAG: sugar-binding transcriptional regulator [Parvibaculaceae bacterium]
MYQSNDQEQQLLVRLAWLYYVGGHSQEEISEQTGLSRFKILRLLSKARDARIVKISIDHHSIETHRLADVLCRRFGLVECIVSPPLGATSDPQADDARARRAVGICAAAFLARRLQGATPPVVGLAWGRTIAAMVDEMPKINRPDARFVSLMGSLSRTARTNPFEVVQKLAETCGGEAYILPAPFITDSEEDYQIIMAQKLVRQTLALAQKADFYIASFGDCSMNSFIHQHGLLRSEEIEDVIASGAVADMLGKFFTRNGELVPSRLNYRTPGISIDDMARHEIVLLAAGLTKAEAAEALLRSGLINRLIVDGDLATALIGD